MGIVYRNSPDFWMYFIFAILLAAAAIFSHRANIRRLLSGTENRLNFKKIKVKPDEKTKGMKRMASKYLIGLDIGTSGAKCILVDDKGAVLASSTQEYPLSTPKPGWAEQNPQDWWDAVVRGLKVILPKANVPKDQIAGVSFSGQMHGLVALGQGLERHPPRHPLVRQPHAETVRLDHRKGRRPFRPAHLHQQPDAGRLYRRQTHLVQGRGAGLFAKMTRFICPKDYIRLKVCGELAIDASDASGTGFFNTRERVWADDLIALAGLDKAIFPDVLESTDLAGRRHPRLRRGNGPARGPAGLRRRAATPSSRPRARGWSSPAWWRGHRTAGNVSMALDRYFDNPKGALQMFCNNAPGLWQAIGCTLSRRRQLSLVPRYTLRASEGNGRAGQGQCL